MALPFAVVRGRSPRVVVLAWATVVTTIAAGASTFAPLDFDEGCNCPGDGPLVLASVWTLGPLAAELLVSLLRALAPYARTDAGTDGWGATAVRTAVWIECVLALLFGLVVEDTGSRDVLLASHGALLAVLVVDAIDRARRGPPTEPLRPGTGTGDQHRNPAPPAG